MFVNIIQCLLLIAFIASSVYVIIQDKDNSYGIVVKAGGRKVVNGKQGVQTTIGRLRENDVVNNSSIVSRKHMNFTYDGTSVIPDESYIGGCSTGEEYSLAGITYDFSKPNRIFKIDMKYLPTIISILFTITRCFSIKQDFDNSLLIVPFVIDRKSVV